MTDRARPATLQGHGGHRSPGTCGETFETLAPFIQIIDLEGVPVRTVSLEALLRTKQSARDRDVQDRGVIERALAAKRERG